MTEGKPVELLRDRRGTYGIGVSDPYDIEALAWACGAGPRDTYRTPHVGNLILRPDMLQFGKQTSTGRVPPCTIASAVMPTRLGTAGTPSIAFAEAGNASRQQDCCLTTAPRDYSKSAALVMRSCRNKSARQCSVGYERKHAEGPASAQAKGPYNSLVRQQERRCLHGVFDEEVRCNIKVPPAMRRSKHR
jgi:hypothetical protein